jgi:hypothetical protein
MEGLREETLQQAAHSFDPFAIIMLEKLEVRRQWTRGALLAQW